MYTKYIFIQTCKKVHEKNTCKKVHAKKYMYV